MALAFILSSGGSPASAAAASTQPSLATNSVVNARPAAELAPKLGQAPRALVSRAMQIDYPMKRRQSVHVAPRTTAAVLGTVFMNEAVRIVCYSNGPEVGGSALWAEIRYFVDGSRASTIKQGWVPDAYVRTGINGRLPGVPTSNCPGPITTPTAARPGDPGTPSHPRDPERGAIPISRPVFDCGPWVCDSYLTRSTTRYIANRLEPLQNEGTAGIVVAAVAACAATGAGAVVSPVCGAVAGIYGRQIINQFVAARNNNACVMIRHKSPNLAAPSFPPLVHVRNNGFCHN